MTSLSGLNSDQALDDDDGESDPDVPYIPGTKAKLLKSRVHETRSRFLSPFYG